MNPNHPPLVSPPLNLQARFRLLPFTASRVGKLAACLLLGVATFSQTARSAPALVGQWFTTNTLADVSGYTPAGTHDGYDVAGTGSYVFTNDVPPNKIGQSLLLFNGDTGIAIANSSINDGAYVNTFDEGLTNAMTVALWAKGWPSGWNPFVSKFGEGPGWQLRNDGANNVSPCWTVRGIGTNSFVTLGTAVYNNPEDLAATGFTFGNDGAWHLYVGTFDAATGMVNLYVDGVLGASSVSNGVYNVSSDSRLCIGAKDAHGTPGNYFTGQVYDVRVYNYAISAATVLYWYGVISPTVTLQPKSVGVFNGSAAQFTANASGTPPLTYQWQLNGTNVNLLPDSGNFTGATSNKLTVLSVSTNDVGSYHLVVTSTLGYGTATSSNASLNIVQKSLVGQWFTNGTLNDLSGYTPAGTHDGYAVGGANYSFTADVPPGLPGQSLSLSTGDSAIAITNSSTADATYTNTFDQNTFTVAFWAKGRGNGGKWDQWVSKGGFENDISGNDNVGWDVGTEAWSQFLVFTMEGSDQGGITYTLGDGLWGNNIQECNPQGLPGDDVNWHHYAATYSVATGVRCIYFDGALVSQQNGNAQYSSAAVQHFVIGGMEQIANGFVAFTTSSMYDVRFYNYDLTASQVLALLPPPYISLQPFQSRNTYVGVTTYIGATVTTFGKATTNQWQLNGTNLVDGPFGGAIISGATSSSTLTIANMTTNLAGVYCLVVAYAGGQTISSNSTITVLQPGPIPTTNLVGAWLTGATNLADFSGYQPAGTHDGYGVTNDGTAGSNFVFTNDVPPGTTGHSLWLLGNTGIAISNSCALDASYTNTFDDTINTNGMTVAFWAKGIPGGWNPWVSKYGESGQGWQLRVNNGGIPCWTMRGPGGDDMTSTLGNNDGGWHNYAGTYDPIAGVRNLYVDGMLAATESGQGALNAATSSHLAVGARDSGGNSFGSYFTGEIYGVRIYDAALTEAQVNYQLLPTAVSAPVFSSPPVLNGNQLVVTWTGGSLLQATNITGPWTPTGATSPFTNNVTTHPQMFYRVSNP